MATATRWHVDDDTEVTLDPSEGEIDICQIDQIIGLTADAAAELVDALLAAIVESGDALPDLSRHGYERSDE